MKRVVVLYSGGRQRGGIETYLANLFRLHDRSRLDLTLISLGEWGLTKELRECGQSVRTRVLSGRRFRLRTVCDIRRVLRQERADLLVSQGVVANAYARAGVLGTGVPSLVVVHSDMAGDYPGRIKRWAFMLSDRLLRPVTKQYIAVSRHLRDAVVASGIRLEQVNVIYNGVSLRESGPESGKGKLLGAETRAEASRGSDKLHQRQESALRIASVGRLHKVKNFDGLIRAMQFLPTRLTLTIWGEGVERENLLALVHALDLSTRVKLPGESENMAEVLRETDIYVQASKSEGCSFAVAEAMLHGRPVVVTPCGGLPEQVDDGSTGVVAENISPQALASAISRLVDDQGLASRLAEAGRKGAEHRFSMSTWLEKTTVTFLETARPGTDPQ